MRWRVIGLLLGLMAAVPPARLYAEEAASKEDIAELKQEVRELRTILIRLLEVEEARARGLADVLADSKSSGSASRRAGSTSAAVSSVAESRTESRASGGEPRREGGAGTISGRVKLVGAGKAPAYVYVEDVPGKMVKGKTVQMRQVEKQFVPQVLVVQRGTKVMFPNDDKIFHNVFSLTPGASFDLGTYRAGESPGAYVFTQTGAVDVFCNLHSNMNASVLVVPNALYTKIDAQGRFTITGVPAGKRKLVVWTPNVPPMTKAVEVAANVETEIEVELEARQGVPVHTNKNGVPYGSYQ